jgi:hypothetical protein
MQSRGLPAWMLAGTSSRFAAPAGQEGGGHEPPLARAVPENPAKSGEEKHVFELSEPT